MLKRIVLSAEIEPVFDRRTYTITLRSSRIASCFAGSLFKNASHRIADFSLMLRTK